MKFNEYIMMLNDWVVRQKVDVSKYSNFNMLVKVQVIEEQIDFKIVEKERTRLIDELNKKLNNAEKKDVVKKSLDFKLGKMLPDEYYSYMKKISEEKGIPRENYYHLFQYVDYLELNEKIDKTKMFDECPIVENAIAETLYQNENQRKLFVFSRNVSILYRMFKLELQRADYYHYGKHKSNFNVDSFLSFIKVQAGSFGINYAENPDVYEIDKNRPIIEEFYDVAIIRDQILLDNTLARMDRQGVDVAVIITGGFHSEGITNIMQEEKIAYAVISPRITEVQDYNPYIDVMTNKKTPFEEFLEQLGE